MKAARMPRGAPAVLAAFAGFFALALLLNVARGAITSDLGTYDDEPSHVVTGLLVRDYVADGAPVGPLAYARDYYLHYPKVGLGQWPPVFYVTQAAWTLLFGANIGSLIALMSALAAAAAVLLFVALRRDLGAALAAAAGALFLVFPLTQAYDSVVMTEIPLALACLAATLELGRFLETGRARHALAFGGLAAVAILTKGNALCLALVPALAIAFSRRWRVLRRPALWGAAALVVAVCAPWYWLTLHISTGTWSGGSRPSLDYALEGARYYAPALLGIGGIAVAASASLGTALAARGRLPGRWAALAALPPSVLAFHLIVPSSIDERHLVLMAPAWAALALYGVHWVATKTEMLRVRRVHLAPALLVALFALDRFEVPEKRLSGYGAATRDILSDAALSESVVLIASDALGEGAFVANLALQEERLGHVVLRASKSLGRSGWFGDGYVPTYESVAEVQAWLRELPVGVIALDYSCRKHQWYRHQDQLREVLLKYPESWELLGTYDVVRAHDVSRRALQVFRHVDHLGAPRTRLSVDGMLEGRLPNF